MEFKEDTDYCYLKGGESNPDLVNVDIKVLDEDKETYLGSLKIGIPKNYSDETIKDIVEEVVPLNYPKYGKYNYSVRSLKESNQTNSTSSLILSILIFITSLFMFNSCDESNKSKSSTNQTRQERLSLTDEEIRTQQSTSVREHAAIKRKVETKIEKLGYKSIQSPRIIIHNDGAKTNTAVKKVIKKRNPNDLFSNEELGDKVYNMSIDFQKFSEYEIFSVKLIDEARMLYWDLE